MNPTIALMMQSAAPNRGVAGDTINARISPHEAMLLRALGAHGTLNPQTGQRHFAAATGTPAAGAVPQPPVLGGYSLAPLMSQSPGGNLIGNAYGAVPAWAQNPFQLGMAPNFANPNWRFPTGGAFAAPGMMPQAAATAAPVKTGVNGGFGSGNAMDGTGRGSANGGRNSG